MRSNRAYVVAAVAVLGATLVLSLWARTVAPDPMPIHWNAWGQPDGFLSRDLALFFFPVFGTFLALFVGLLTASHAESRKVAGPLALVLTAFIFGLEALVVRAALGDGELASGSLLMLLGSLLAVLGPIVSAVGPNPYVGVRLPWTNGDEVVWTLTHRFARWAYVLTGGLVAAAGLLLPPMPATVTALSVTIVGMLSPVPYSLVVHLQRRR